MKKSAIYISFVLVGVAIGYIIGTKGGLSGWDLFWEIFFGGSLFYGFALALFKWDNEYGVLIGAVIGLSVSMSLDGIAGSPVDMRDKLSYMLLCSFVGWGYRWGRVYWRPILVGGLLGGVVGFILGFNRDFYFGLVYLPAGSLNALLSFGKVTMIGMAFASLYMKSLGAK